MAGNFDPPGIVRSLGSALQRITNLERKLARDEAARVPTTITFIMPLSEPANYIS